MRGFIIPNFKNQEIEAQKKLSSLLRVYTTDKRDF